jgi:hypothetical protein
MHKPNEFMTSRERRLSRCLATMTTVAGVSFAVMLLQQPLFATAGITTPVVAKPKAPPLTYQLRCWQHGRLLFDEGPVALGAEARQGAQLVVTDRSGTPLIITVAGETVCQARPYLSNPPPAAAP